MNTEIEKTQAEEIQTCPRPIGAFTYRLFFLTP